jgi:hypothetical protein
MICLKYTITLLLYLILSIPHHFLIFIIFQLSQTFLRLDFPKPKLNLGSGKEKKNKQVMQQTNSSSSSTGIRSFFNSSTLSSGEKGDMEIPDISKSNEQEQKK